jgi:hypothetical protein
VGEMNKQRKVLITITYNEMGIITDTKAEEVIQPETNCSEIPNNSDTISKQQAIDALMAAIDDVGVLDGADIKVVFDNLPPAQPEPKEGHWIRTDCGLDVECKCSVCGYKDFVEPHDTYWFKRNYCPNCGAKMTISTK